MTRIPGTPSVDQIVDIENLEDQCPEYALDRVVLHVVSPAYSERVNISAE